MDIEATKLELIKLLLNTQKEQVLQRIKEIFEQEEGIDFWDKLSSEDQAAINEGMKQLDKGQYVSHESVREDIKKRFNF
jgi:predicted transcriptional regulator